MTMVMMVMMVMMVTMVSRSQVELCEMYRVRAMKRAYEELVRNQVWCHCRALEALAPAVASLRDVDPEAACVYLRDDMRAWADGGDALAADAVAAG